MIRRGYRRINPQLRRWDVLNRLLQSFEHPTSFLEIGVWMGDCGRRVVANRKVGVDIAFKAEAKRHYHQCYEGASDSFFESNTSTFDVVFIDGMHTHQQALRDFENSMQCLGVGGFIVFHDSNPVGKELQLVPRPLGQGEWTGDVWRTIAMLRVGSFKLTTVDIETGVTVVEPGKTMPSLSSVPVDYEEFDRQRQSILNLTSVRDWLNG